MGHGETVLQCELVQSDGCLILWKKLSESLKFQHQLVIIIQKESKVHKQLLRLYLWQGREVLKRKSKHILLIALDMILIERMSLSMLHIIGSQAAKELFQKQSLLFWPVMIMRVPFVWQ